MLDPIAAERAERDLDRFIASHFDTVDPEARELYGEFTSTPAPEVLERQRTGVDRVVQMPDPDSLTPSPAFSY